MKTYADALDAFTDALQAVETIQLGERVQSAMIGRFAERNVAGATGYYWQVSIVRALGNTKEAETNTGEWHRQKEIGREKVKDAFREYQRQGPEENGIR